MRILSEVEGRKYLKKTSFLMVNSGDIVSKKMKKDGLDEVYELGSSSCRMKIA